MGEPETREISHGKPSEVVMLILLGVPGFPVPTRHEEGVRHQGGVHEVYGYSLHLQHVDGDLFAALAFDRLFG